MMVSRVAMGCFFRCARLRFGWVLLLIGCFWADRGMAQSTDDLTKAERILILGNSITLHGPKPEIGWTGNWGMAASSLDKDYAHLLVAALNKKTGPKLIIEPVSASNILNIADIFERNYASYEPARIRKQLDWKADIVVLQFGENVPASSFKAEIFHAKLKALMGDIKAAGNPRIYVTGNILGGVADIDDIKKKVCADDPSRRSFVDMARYRSKGNLNGAFGHPGDKGMQEIADLLLDSIIKK
jgi:alpha-galactosidase